MIYNTKVHERMHRPWAWYGLHGGTGNWNRPGGEEGKEKGLETGRITTGNGGETATDLWWRLRNLGSRANATGSMLKLLNITGSQSPNC